MIFLGVDFGLRNIGLAISDENSFVASKLGNMVNYGNDRTAKEIKRIIELYKIESVVLGYPFFYGDMKAKEMGIKPKRSEMRNKMNSFKEYIEQDLKRPVYYWDESYSSKIIEKDMRGKALKTSDSEVARLILQEYLDHQALMKKIDKAQNR